MRKTWLWMLSLLTLVPLAGCLSLHNVGRSGDHVHETRDVAYVDDNNARHRLDIYAPADAHDAPVVVFVHGGTWITGDRSYYEPIVGLYANLGRALARHGIVAVVPSYRIHPFGKLPDMIDDVTSALAWTHAHIGDFGGAPDRIVMAGHSAGAHLVSTLASDDATLTSRHADPSWVRGYALIGGIYDIPGVMDAVDLDEHVALLEVFGATLAQQASASTGERLHIGTRPLLLLAAKNDCRRCKADYAAVHARLASSEGGGVWFHELAGPTHAQEVLWVGTDDDEVTPWLRAFVERATDTGTTTAAAMARAH